MDEIGEGGMVGLMAEALSSDLQKNTWKIYSTGEACKDLHPILASKRDGVSKWTHTSMSERGTLDG